MCVRKGGRCRKVQKGVPLKVVPTDNSRVDFVNSSKLDEYFFFVLFSIFSGSHRKYVNTIAFRCFLPAKGWSGIICLFCLRLVYQCCFLFLSFSLSFSLSFFKLSFFKLSFFTFSAVSVRCTVAIGPLSPLCRVKGMSHHCRHPLVQ